MKTLISRASDRRTPPVETTISSIAELVELCKSTGRQLIISVESETIESDSWSEMMAAPKKEYLKVVVYDDYIE